MEAMYPRYMHAYGEEGIKVLDIQSSAHNHCELRERISLEQYDVIACLLACLLARSRKLYANIP